MLGGLPAAKDLDEAVSDRPTTILDTETVCHLPVDNRNVRQDSGRVEASRISLCLPVCVKCKYCVNHPC